MSPLRALASLAILRAANAIVPPRDPETRIDRARFHLALALLDVALRLDGRELLADRMFLEQLKDLTDTEPPPSTLRSAEDPSPNARGGAA